MFHTKVQMPMQKFMFGFKKQKIMKGYDIFVIFYTKLRCLYKCRFLVNYKRHLFV